MGDNIFFNIAVSQPRRGADWSGFTPRWHDRNRNGNSPGGWRRHVQHLHAGRRPHSITASYAGDSNNTSGVSSPLVVVVKYLTAPTQTTLVTNVSTSVAGAPVILTATVVVTNAVSSTGTVAGSVTFSDGSTIVGAGSVTGGIASITVSNLTVGQHAITASYAGASGFAASASSAVSVTVQAGTTTVNLSSSSNPSVGGASVTLTASIAGNGPTPTGNVSFADGSVVLGTAVLNKSGIAVLKVTGLAVATHSIVATYSGDLSNNGSVSNALLQIVNLAATSVALSSSLSPAAQGSAVTLTAAVTGNGGVPGGTVQFFDGVTNLGAGTLTPGGTATFTTSTLGLGAHTITAAYNGDALDGPATSVPLTETIQSATTVIALASSSNPSLFGSLLTVTVSVQGTGSQPTGTITLQDGSISLGTQPVGASGLATFSMANLTIGTHNLAANYSGDTIHAPSSATLTQRVVQVTTTALVASASTAIAGTAVTWTAVVNGVSGQPVTGTVQFKDGSAVIATVPVDAAGTAVFHSSSLTVGVHSISAAYSGDSLNESANSNVVVLTVQIATTSTSLVSSANPAYTTAALSLTATVTGNGGTPTGSITFMDGATTLGTAPVAASGTASLSTSSLTPGIHSITAKYGGDANDSISVSSAVSQQIVQQTAVTLTSSANPAMFQDSVTITVFVTGGLAAYPATGTVTLTDGGTTIGTATPNAAGNALFTLSSPSLGAHVLTASYAGDTRNSPATSLVFTQSIILRPTTTGLRSSSSVASSGESVTLASVIQGPSPNIPTGIVTFVSGSTILGTARLDASGLAVLTFTPPQGSFNVVAQYPGDTLFAASSSTQTPLVVGPPIEFTLSATPPSISLQSGDHTTLHVTIVPASTFVDTLAIGCAGLPADATCTFSQDQVNVSGGSSQTISLVVDTGNPLGAGASARLSTGPANTAFACMLPGGVLFALLLLRPRNLRNRFAALAMVLLLCALATLSGCGNSLNVDKTPAGSYTFQITAAGATSGVTQSAAVSLTVTQ